MNPLPANKLPAGPAPDARPHRDAPTRNPLLENPLLLNALHDDAHARAEALRREALDDLWRGADSALGTAATRALRAGHRLARRLRRHALARQHG